MVYYFETIDDNGNQYFIYMGEHKEENEDLIKYGFPEDIWFHVDKFSSAHVYLRLKEGQTIDNIPPNVLEDCCQLVKYNSIEGNKVNNVTIVYTPWSNLKKTNGMEVGQVGFHQSKLVYKYKIEKRKNEIVNRLNKSKTEAHPDLQSDKEQREKQDRDKKKAILFEQVGDYYFHSNLKKQKEKEEKDRKKQEEELKSYSSLMKTENMKTNKEQEKNWNEYEDDFM